jgi:hypothetical protein
MLLEPVATKPPCPQPPTGSGSSYQQQQQQSGFNLNGPEYLMYSSCQDLVENVFKSDLDYERERRKELERRLEAKDNQVPYRVLPPILKLNLQRKIGKRLAFSAGLFKMFRNPFEQLL